MKNAAMPSPHFCSPALPICCDYPQRWNPAMTFLVSFLKLSSNSVCTSLVSSCISGEGLVTFAVEIIS